MVEWRSPDVGLGNDDIPLAVVCILDYSGEFLVGVSLTFMETVAVRGFQEEVVGIKDLVRVPHDQLVLLPQVA